MNSTAFDYEVSPSMSPRTPDLCSPSPSSNEVVTLKRSLESHLGAPRPLDQYEYCDWFSVDAIRGSTCTLCVLLKQDDTNPNRMEVLNTQGGVLLNEAVGLHVSARWFLLEISQATNLWEPVEKKSFGPRICLQRLATSHLFSLVVRPFCAH